MDSGTSLDGSLSSEEIRAAAVLGIRWSSIARPTTELLQLASIVVLAHLIVPAEFGRFAVALIVQEVAQLITSGVSSALVQKKTLTREHLESGMAIGVVSGFALMAIVLIVGIFVVHPIFGARTALFVELLAPMCLVSGFGTASTAIMSRTMKFRRLGEMEVVGTFVRVVFCVGLALAGLSGEALVFGVLAGGMVSMAIVLLSVQPPMPRLHRRAARELLAYGLPVSLATIGWIGFSNVDYAIIGARLGPLATGLYSRAYMLAVEYQNKVSVVMTQVGFPVLSRIRGTDDLESMHQQMVRLLTILLFPLLVILSIIAPVLVPFLFGHRWVGAVVPVQILALGGAATLVTDAAGTVLMATGRTRAVLGFGVAHFLSYGLAVFLVVKLGITAVAIAAAVVHSLFLVVAYTLLLRDSPEQPLRRLWDDVSPAAVSCLGLVAVALPVSLAVASLHLPAVLRLAAVALTGLSAYALTLRTLFPGVWRNQSDILERVLPGNRRFGRAKRPQPVASIQGPGARPLPPAQTPVEYRG